MALKRIRLNLAHRQVANLLIQAAPDKTLDTARHVAAVRRRLDLRKAARVLERMDEKVRDLRDLGLEPPQWDDLVYWDECLEEMDRLVARTDDEKDKEALAKFREWFAAVAAEKEYTIDDAYLRWMRDLLKDHDWGKAKRAGAMGTVHEVEIAVSAGQMEAVADFGDRLSDALAAPAIRQEREDKKDAESDS